MQYEASSPADYMSQLENDWRKEKLQEIRKIIQDADPKLTEGIQYKMLAYNKGDKTIFQLNAQKGYVSLYVGNIDKVKDSRDLLKDFNLGKGCIRIKKSNKLAESGLPKFVKNTVEVWRNGGETDC